MMKKVLALALCVCMAAMLLAGCGGAGSSSAAASASGSAAAGTSASAAGALDPNIKATLTFATTTTRPWTCMRRWIWRADSRSCTPT